MAVELKEAAEVVAVERVEAGLAEAGGGAVVMGKAVTVEAAAEVALAMAMRAAVTVVAQAAVT
eukprot:2245757-Prymnesium_polylepis.1